MASRETAIGVGRDECDKVRSRRLKGLDHDRDGRGGKPPQRALLPRGDDCANGIVVVDGGAGARKREAPASAFPAAADRPRSGRAAAAAKRRLDPRQAGEASRAELRAAKPAHHASLRQEQIEHALEPRPRRRTGLCQLCDNSRSACSSVSGEPMSYQRPGTCQT